MSNRDGRNTSSPQIKPEGSESEEDICELEHLRKLFIGGLVPYTTEESLKSFYGQWGKVVDVVVMRDPVTKRSRGFGFITYTKSSMVDKAQENRPHVIDGKTVEAKRALPRPERETRETNISVKKLFVGGLKDNHDEECLREYFSQFGKVISIKILTDKTTGKRRGFAFIEFDDYDAVDKAILQKTHSIKYVVVDVKKSVYNQEQQSRQQNSNIPLTNNGQQLKPPPKGNEHSAYPPPQQPAMPPYQHPPPMAGPPPPNYNYWGPAPPAMPPQQYGGYQQPPPQNWNYPPAPNGWNSGPPPPPNAGHGPAPYWYPNQWGCPPPAAPPAPVAPPGIPGQPPTWNAPPSTAAPVPPPGPPNNTTVPQQPPPNNFGTGYQQNYGGGPTKHMNSNRMNPYSAPPVNNYVSNGGYNGGPPKPPPVSTGAGSASANGGSGSSQGGNKFRR